MDLIETKEYRAVKAQLDYQVTTVENQVERYKNHDLEGAKEARDKSLPQNIVTTKKIIWYGEKKDNQLAHVLKTLSAHGRIEKSYQTIANTHFMHEDGTPISHNLSTMANGPIPKETKAILGELDKELSTKYEKKG